MADCDIDHIDYSIREQPTRPLLVVPLKPATVGKRWRKSSLAPLPLISR
jgi:hypothetical protein